MIYAIRAPSGAVKIGRARDPRGRLAALQTANPDQLVLLGTSETSDDESTELELHKFCRSAHLRGEWFRPSERVSSAVDAIVSGQAERFATRRQAASLLYKHRGAAEDIVRLLELGYGCT